MISSIQSHSSENITVNYIMSFLQTPEEFSDKIPALLNTTKHSLDKDVEVIENWMKSQPHLPEIMGENLPLYTKIPIFFSCRKKKNTKFLNFE